jgi:hypothetical protein
MLDEPGLLETPERQDGRRPRPPPEPDEVGEAAPGLARITASKAWSDLAADRRFGAGLLSSSPLAGTLAFGSSLLLLNAPSAYETMSGNEPARIRDVASAAVESDLRRAIMSEGSGSGMDRISREEALL